MRNCAIAQKSKILFAFDVEQCENVVHSNSLFCENNLTDYACTKSAFLGSNVQVKTLLTNNLFRDPIFYTLRYNKFLNKDR